MITNINEFKKIQERISDTKIHKGKMHELLGLKEDESITDKYSKGEDLYHALMKATDNNEKEVVGMLAYAANLEPQHNVFDSALHYAKKEKTNENSFSSSVNSINKARQQHKEETWQNWYMTTIAPAVTEIHNDLILIKQVVENFENELKEKRYYTTDIIAIKNDLKNILERFPK